MCLLVQSDKGNQVQESDAGSPLRQESEECAYFVMREGTISDSGDYDQSQSCQDA